MIEPILHCSGKHLSFPRLACLFIAVATTAMAQGNRSFFEAGSVEAGVFLGASYGIVNYQYMVGGNVTFALNKRVLPYVEYTYLPQVAFLNVSQSLPLGSTYTVNRGVSFSDFHGGVHIRLPIHDSPIVPYLVLGAGALTHFQQDYTVTVTSSNGSTTSTQLQEPAGSNFAVNAGVGLRFYLRSERFGFRTEAKVYKPTGDFSSPFGKVEFGVFYQFR